MVASPRVLLGKYKLGRLLGRGGSGKVFQAQSLTDDNDVAIKIINKSSIKNTTMEARITREVTAMNKLNHPNIINIHEVMATKTKIHIVMEYAQGGDLFTKLTHGGRFKEPIARRYFQQLVSALHFCHLNGVTHRDLNPNNLLLDGEDNVKISDFGLSALSEQLKGGGLLHTACGTPAYTAPEVVMGFGGYDGKKSDSWSCGVILFEFLAGYLPFDDSNIVSMFYKICRREFEFPSWFSMSVRGIISRLLDPNPNTRMSIEELMDVEWFKNSLVQKPRVKTVRVHEDYEFHYPSKCYSSPVMNAFDIISMSSGLDLSGILERGKVKDQRFTTKKYTWGEIVEKVEEIGEKLGYEIEGSNGGVVELGTNGRLLLLVEVLEVGASLVLVKMKVDGGQDDELELEGRYWEDLKVELDGHDFK